MLCFFCFWVDTCEHIVVAPFVWPSHFAGVAFDVFPRLHVHVLVSTLFVGSPGLAGSMMLRRWHGFVVG